MAPEQVKRPHLKLISTIEGYRLARINLGEGNVYKIAENGSRKHYLGMESWKKVSEPNIITGYWKVDASLNEFLSQINPFFNEYSNLDGKHLECVNASIHLEDGKVVKIDKINRPVTKQALIDGSEGILQGESETPWLLRIEGEIATFTWNLGNIGFILSPSSFPDQAALVKSLSTFYTSTNPKTPIPTDVFEKALKIVSTDNFQLKPKQ